MGSITDIKSVLTRKGLDIFCQNFHISEDLHPQLPSSNQTIHEMPVGKIGVYTRFFKYANFRLPLSTFFVNILRHYRINISQLSVIATAKVSHFEILCRVYNIDPTVGLFRCFYVNSKNKGWMSFSKRPDSNAVYYTKPLDSLKHWNDHLFLVDSFACPASFPWHTGKNVSKDSFPKSTEFNADHYATFVAHSALFQKFPEPFLCLVGISRYYTLDEETYPRFLHDDGTEMDLFAFIHAADPTKVRIVERGRAEGEVKLLDSTVGRVVLLLPVNPAHAKSKLEASVDKLFDEGGSAKQGHFAVGGGHDAEIELDVEDTAAENVAVERLKCLRKKRAAATDARGSSHPPKKLRGDHGTSSGAATGGKSPFVIRELLASSVLNVEFGVAAVTTLPLVTSSVSTTPECEVDHPTNSMTGANLRTMGLDKRFVIPSDSSHHSSTNAPKAEVDSIIRSVVPPSIITEAVVTFTTTGIPSVSIPDTSAKINSPIHASMFHDSGSVGTVKPDVAGPSHLSGKELSMGSREVDSENLHEIFIPHWNISNDTLLDDLEFNIGTARQACLNAEARDVEIENLKAQLLLKETEAAEAAHLRGQVFAAEATKRIHADEIKALKQRNVALENEKNSLGGKVVKLQTSVSTKDLELKDLNAALSSLQSQNDRLVDQHLMKRLEEFQDAQLKIVNDKVAKLDVDLLVLIKCLNSSEYLTALRAAFSHAIEKGMHSGLVAGIVHIKEGKNLADV
ncbi:hypothetical protein Tco_1323743 [Tanacetum coccineum]